MSSNLAYQYQRAIDAADALREIIRDVAERDRELWPSGAMMIESLAWRLERATVVVFEARRNRLLPGAADETILTAPSGGGPEAPESRRQKTKPSPAILEGTR